MPRHSEVTDKQMLDAALSLALRHGYERVTREQIAERLGCSAALVNVRFGTMTRFRRDLMRYAVQVGEAVVIGQGLARRDSHAMKASKELKERAALLLAR